MLTSSCLFHIFFCVLCTVTLTVCSKSGICQNAHILQFDHQIQCRKPVVKKYWLLLCFGICLANCNATDSALHFSSSVLLAPVYIKKSYIKPLFPAQTKFFIPHFFGFFQIILLNPSVSCLCWYDLFVNRFITFQFYFLTREFFCTVVRTGFTLKSHLLGYYHLHVKTVATSSIFLRYN